MNRSTRPTTNLPVTPAIPASPGATVADPLDVAAQLNRLIETCIDTGRQFSYAAGDVIDASLRPFLVRVAQQRAELASELQEMVTRLGGAPATHGTIAGTLREGWMELKAAAAIREDHAILQELERCEDIVRDRFERVLRQSLPPDVQTLVQRQAVAVRGTHDEIRALRGRS
jgi:uncharacterized protein (TIGR02284 family)